MFKSIIKPVEKFVEKPNTKRIKDKQRNLDEISEECPIVDKKTYHKKLRRNCKKLIDILLNSEE